MHSFSPKPPSPAPTVRSLLSAIPMDGVLEQAFTATLQAVLGNESRPPAPLDFKGHGALRAWEAVFAKFAATRSGRAALADPTVDPDRAGLEFIPHAVALALESIDPELLGQTRQTTQQQAHQQTLQQGLLLQACMGAAWLLAFWLRKGKVFEPTPVLSTLLGGTDISDDLPLRWLTPPAGALCIIPPLGHRDLCGGVEAILVFAHERLEELSQPTRAITVIQVKNMPGGLDMAKLTLLGADTDRSLVQAIAETLQTPPLGLDGQPDPMAEGPMNSESRWRQVLDYAAKVLIYARLDDARLTFDDSLSRAVPPDLSGLGKRKREERLAVYDRLYDRTIVGPLTPADWAGTAASELGELGALTPHWRRGHLRMQAHGPQLSLRKPLFIFPTLVRGRAAPQTAL